MNRRTFLRTSLIAAGIAVIPSAPALVSAAGYDRHAAVRYAYEWTQDGECKRNPKFPDFSKFPFFGNDCTNFASQVIHAGGIGLDGDGWFRTEYTINEWYCRSDRGVWRWSSSWINVNDFRIYHTSNNRRGRIGGVFTPILAQRLRERAQPGDLLQAMTSYAFNSGWHTMVITKKEKGEIFLTYHSGPKGKDVVDLPLRELLKRIHSSDLVLIQFR